MIQQTAWSVQNPDGSLQNHQAFNYRREVIRHYGNLWENGNPSRGWRKAYRLGFRIVPVTVILVK